MRVPLVAALALCGALFLSTLSCVDPRPSPFGGSLTVTQAAAQAQSPIARILTDARLWGEDAFAVFGSLDRWKEAGDTSVILYPDRVVSGTRSEALDPARQRLARMTAAMQRTRPPLRPEFTGPYSGAVAARAAAFRAEVVRLREDDSFRVVWRRDGGEFLKRGVTTRAVFDAYGRPEKTTTEVVHSEGDRRPAVLTMHHYANDAIKFAESDLAPAPGLVDRVVVDVAAATAQIFAATP